MIAKHFPVGLQRNQMPTTPNANIPYLTLDPQLEEQIAADIRTNAMSALAFKDEDILRREDLPNDRATLARPAFMRDVEKIVNVPAYNRYAGKTQVFSFVNNDDITRRGLHVQLVNRVAKGIGRLLRLNTDLIEAIALGHDVGHTPFGHAGERFLSQCYHQHTGLYFNHNVHSVRVLDELYPRNISLQTLDGVLAHNGEFACQTLSTSGASTFAELDAAVAGCTADASTIKHLRPATLEGCVVRASDMIAYIGKDRADALQMGVLDDIDVFESTVLGKDNGRIINNMTVDIVNNSYGKGTISMSEEMFQDLKRAKRQNYHLIYEREGMLEDASNVVEHMFGRLYERMLEDLRSGDEASPIFTHHIRPLVNTSQTITKEAYLEQDPNRIVVDYIASMTDGYFTSIYEKLFPDETYEIEKRGYFANL